MKLYKLWFTDKYGSVYNCYVVADSIAEVCEKFRKHRAATVLNRVDCYTNCAVYT